MVDSKHAFWQALIFTIIIFVLGLFFGFFLESGRVTKVQDAVSNAESNLLDEQIRNNLVQNFNISCDIAVESTFLFADKIYADATRLELYDSSSKFTQDLELLHRKYDLLRMMVWEEARTLKANCPGRFHTVIYLFDYKTENVNIKAQQTAFSRILIELKETYGNEILLIPIAADLNLSSIDLVKKKYHIFKSPAVIVDEREVITQISTVAEYENTIFKSHKQ